MGYRRRRMGGLDPLMPRRGGFVGAYDAFAASLAHAYEPARRTLTAYTGNLLRLRRASDDAESDFGYVANGDLDVVAIAAWLGGANGYVKTVYDQTTNADHVTQTTAAQQPLFVESAYSGHAGMYFDSSKLTGAFTNGGALSQPFNVFAVIQIDVGLLADGGNHYITDGDDVTNRMIVGKASGVSNPWTINAGTILSSGVPNTDWHIFSARFDGASSQFWIDGISVITGNAGAHNADGIAIGASYFGVVAPWKGYIASVVICDPALADY